MSSYEPHLNPNTKLGDVICFNYIAFHILDVELSADAGSTSTVQQDSRPQNAKVEVANKTRSFGKSVRVMTYQHLQLNQDLKGLL